MCSLAYLVSIVSVMLFMATSCVDPLDQTLRKRVDIVVVDGTVTNLNEPQVVRLNRSKSDSLTGRFGTLPLTGVIVEVIVDSSRIVLLHETDAGSYEAPDGFMGMVGHAYQLQFTLKDGSRYQSAPEVMLPVASIRRVNTRFSPTALPAQLCDGTLNPYRGANEFLWTGRTRPISTTTTAGTGNYGKSRTDPYLHTRILHSK